jgi:IS5 family transposase
VSLHLPHIRPIVRGKDGRDVEFGPKIVLSWVDGYGFLDALKFEAHNEGALWGESLDLHKKRFGAFPTESTGDGIFGTRANRAMLKGKGRPGWSEGAGAFGEDDGKQEMVAGETEIAWEPDGRDHRTREENNFGLDRIRYTIKDGEEMWIRLGLLAMNLSTAVKKMGQGGGSMGEARATA